MYRINEIITKEQLNDSVVKMVIYSPLVSRKCEPGEFIILRPKETSERIPLTIAGYNREDETVTIIFQTIGMTTMELSTLNVGEQIHDFVGPLGKPTVLDGYKNVCVIGGGVGCAIALPVVQKLHMLKANVHSIIGFRNKDLVILEKEFNESSNLLKVMTDDGSYKEKGFVTSALEELIQKGNNYDLVVTIGPLPMMKAVVNITKKYNIKTIVSMNPIMIDGTGMCGCCRLMCNGKMKFACIDGPDFDGFEVDFDEAINRSKTYQSFERQKRDEFCNLMKERPNE